MVEHRDVVGFRAVDLQGEIRRLGMDDDIRDVMVIFTDPQCQYAQAQKTQIEQLLAAAHKQGFSPYLILSSETLTASAAKAYASSLSPSAPVILDSYGELFHRLKPQAFPEAMIVNIDDQLLYQGGLAGLASALPAAAKGEPTTGLSDNGGCAASAQRGELPTLVDYNRHIGPMVDANCLDCHRPGGVAPFSLQGYKQTRPWAGMMAHVTEQRFMPPWRGTSAAGHRFRNERILSDRQIALFQQWSRQLAPQGSVENYLGEPRVETSDWRLGKPDILLTMEEPFEVPASGDDIYRYFVIKDAIPKDMMVVAIDFKPGDPEVVHHCNFFLDYERRARRMDRKDPEPGFQVMGNGFMDYFGGNSGQFPMGAWAPGGEAVRLPEGMGIMMSGGADFVIEIHYHLNGKKTQDQSQIALYLAKKPVTKTVTGLFAGTQDVDIPAGDSDYWRHFYMDVSNDFDLIDVFAHMHYIGQQAKIIATLPDGTIKPLLLIKDWDIRWQNVYVYRKPIFIPKGTRIDSYLSFDNSADNPANPFNPPVRMKWGWGSDEEMAEMYMTVYPRTTSSRRFAQAANRLARDTLKPWSRGANVRKEDVPSDDLFKW